MQIEEQGACQTECRRRHTGGLTQKFRQGQRVGRERTIRPQSAQPRQALARVVDAHHVRPRHGVYGHAQLGVVCAIAESPGAQRLLLVVAAVHAPVSLPAAHAVAARVGHVAQVGDHAVRRVRDPLDGEDETVPRLHGCALERRCLRVVLRHGHPPACVVVAPACTLPIMELLISVIGEQEVAAAVAGRADIVDVKNPREGSLGANFPHVIRAVRDATPATIPVSVAIGDVPNLPGTAALAAAGAAGCGVQYVKVGLLGPRDHDEAFAVLAAVCRAAKEQDPAVRVMATAYADARKTGSLPPLELPSVAAEAGVDGCMIDTAGKSGGTLFTALGRTELETFVARCRRAGLLCALAGSLSATDVPRLRELAPDIVGFRGAACGDGRRDGSVDRDAVLRLKDLVAQA